jgi:hypothetical protein
MLDDIGSETPRSKDIASKALVPMGMATQRLWGVCNDGYTR